MSIFRMKIFLIKAFCCRGVKRKIKRKILNNIKTKCGTEDFLLIARYSSVRIPATGPVLLVSERLCVTLLPTAAYSSPLLWVPYGNWVYVLNMAVRPRKSETNWNWKEFRMRKVRVDRTHFLAIPSLLTSLKTILHERTKCALSIAPLNVYARKRQKRV